MSLTRKEIKHAALDFWFTKKSEEDQLKKAKQNEQVTKLDREVMDMMVYCREAQESMSIDLLIKCVESLNRLENRRIAVIDARIVYPIPAPYSELRRELNKMVEKKSPAWFRTPIMLHHTEQVNGFQLVRMEDSVDEQYVPYSYFLTLETLFNTPNTMTKEEFMKKFEETACADWGKQDENGECFGGFWKYPEGTHEKENAFVLSRQASGNALFNLPYSHALIFKTIEIGCGNRRESVRYSNSICEYVKRKLANKTDV